MEQSQTLRARTRTEELDTDAERAVMKEETPPSAAYQEAWDRLDKVAAYLTDQLGNALYGRLGPVMVPWDDADALIEAGPAESRGELIDRLDNTAARLWSLASLVDTILRRLTLP